MKHSQIDHDGKQAMPGVTLLVTAAVFALIALLISAYLSLQTLTGETVAGCGADDGCGAVLASPWSAVAGVPVSLLGAATYLAVLIGLGLRLGSRGPHRLGDFLLLAAAPAMLIASGWFTYIQIVEIKEICPYCMLDHAIGTVLGILLPVIVFSRTLLKPALPLAVGAVGCIGLIALQHATLAEDTQSTANPFVDRDGDEVIDGKRHISMFGGALHLVLEETPHLGDANAKQVVGIVFDYACPHCRATHQLIKKAMKEDPSAFAVVPLPVSLDEEHNPHLNSDDERFDDSYGLALLAQAVSAVDMAKWRSFDQWLFSGEADDFPRPYEDARVKAAQLIGEATLSDLMNNDNLILHREAIDRNIALLGLIPEDSRYIPIVTSPGTPRHLTERFYEIDVLLHLLDEADAGLELPEDEGQRTTN